MSVVHVCSQRSDALLTRRRRQVDRRGGEEDLGDGDDLSSRWRAEYGRVLVKRDYWANGSRIRRREKYAASRRVGVEPHLRRGDPDAGVPGETSKPRASTGLRGQGQSQVEGVRSFACERRAGQPRSIERMPARSRDDESTFTAEIFYAGQRVRPLRLPAEHGTAPPRRSGR